VFNVDGRTFAWREITAAARLDDSWRELEQTTRLGLACRKRLAAAGEQPAAHVVAEAVRRFRYARDLLAADELLAWLEHWQLTSVDWHEYVVRMLLRERWMGELADTASRFSVGHDEVTGALWAEAACSGFLTRAAERVAGDAALAAAAGEAIGGAWEQPALLARIGAVAARARVEALTEEAIAREVDVHRLEWLRIDGEILTVPSEDAAREAALCIRMDQRSLADVGAACGARPNPLSTYLADADAALSPALVAAREGDLIGPVARDGAFALLLVEQKTPPSVFDGTVRQRATERIIARAVHRAMSEHVEWHEHC
jgi:hypothetical protein